MIDLTLIDRWVVSLFCDVGLSGTSDANVAFSPSLVYNYRLNLIGLVRSYKNEMSEHLSPKEWLSENKGKSLNDSYN